MEFATKIVDELMGTEAFGATLALHQYLINYSKIIFTKHYCFHNLLSSWLALGSKEPRLYSNKGFG